MMFAINLRKALALMLFLVSPLLVDAQQTLSVFDRIERTIAQREPQWVLVNKWPNPNPKFRVTTLRWQLENNEMMVWMIELPTFEDATREFYNLTRPTIGQVPQHCNIGDKCYVATPSGDLFFKRGTLVVRVMGGDAVQPATSFKLDTMARFAQLIASEIPAEPVRPRLSPVELKAEASRLRDKAGKAFGEGRYEESIEDYRRAIELDPNSAELYRELGLAYLSLGDRAKASEAFREAIRLKPDWAEAHYDLGRAHYESGEYDTAATSFEEAIRLKPDYFDALIALGNTYQHKGQYPRSVEVFTKAVVLRPANVDAKCALGNAFVLSGQPQEAVPVLREAVRLSPQSALAYATMGQAYRQLGKFQDAVVALQEALRISPEDPLVHNYLGLTYESLRRPQDALAAYSQAIQIKSDFAEAHYNLGLLYHALGDRNQAQHHYEILQTLNPNMAAALLKKMM